MSSRAHNLSPLVVVVYIQWMSLDLCCQASDPPLPQMSCYWYWRAHFPTDSQSLHWAWDPTPFYSMLYFRTVQFHQTIINCVHLTCLKSCIWHLLHIWHGILPFTCYSTLWWNCIPLAFSRFWFSVSNCQSRDWWWSDIFMHKSGLFPKIQVDPVYFNRQDIKVAIYVLPNVQWTKCSESPVFVEPDTY